jgi:hypothetical protein
MAAHRRPRKKLPPDVLVYFQETGREGGYARARSLSAKERKRQARKASRSIPAKARRERARKAARARWGHKRRGRE